MSIKNMSLLNVGVHMLSLTGEHLLVQKCFMFSSSVVCVMCSAPVKNGTESERRQPNPQWKPLLYDVQAVDFKQQWHNTYQAKHYDHMSKHCVLYISYKVFTFKQFIKSGNFAGHCKM